MRISKDAGIIQMTPAVYADEAIISTADGITRVMFADNGVPRTGVCLTDENARQLATYILSREAAQ